MNDNKVCIIAEAGVNHNGDIKLALEMCDAAKKIGADIVKFQTFKTENNVLKNCHMAEYQIANIGIEQSHWEMVKSLELTEDEFIELKKHCEKIGIKFLSAPSEEDSLNFLVSLGCDCIKISSGEITNYPFLEKIGKLKSKVILSTGMSDIKEIEDALKILVKAGTNKKDIVVLHCNTEYPTPMEDVNLKAMLTIKNYFNITVGYSDHTLGTEISIAAVALGAKVIEKHFTLSRSMRGPDHIASLEPEEFKFMVKAIRNVEKSLGNGEKKPTASELKNKIIARKTIVAKTNIKKGDIFTEENITVKRPEMGKTAMEWPNVIGKEAEKDFVKDEVIIKE